jgi:hypothetical protein
MHEYAVTPQLTVSFQRYPHPPSGCLSALPRSWGALPVVAVGSRHLVLPSPTREALWIGLIPTGGNRSTRVRVLASIRSGGRVDAVTGAVADDFPSTGPGEILVPPRYAVEGILRAEGTWWAFARDPLGTAAPACDGLDLLVRAGTPAEPSGPTADPRCQHEPPGATGPHRPAGPTPDMADPGATASLHIDLLEAGEFEEVSGKQLPPLDPTAPYNGRRLP